MRALVLLSFWVTVKGVTLIFIFGNGSAISSAQEGESGPKVIKLFSYSTQLSTEFILLINVKMPTIVGIFTFISMINTTSESLKARNIFICRYLSFYEQLKCHAQLS